MLAGGFAASRAAGLAHRPPARNVGMASGRGLAPLVDSLRQQQLRSDMQAPSIGDSVRLTVKVVEGAKTRMQRLEGTVIAQSGHDGNKTITVRRIFQGVGIEMNIPLHAPTLASVEVLKRAKVRRAKLYYLRERMGKNARLKELVAKRP